MDRDLISEKLESLRRCVHRVSEKCPPDLDTLEQDVDLQDIVTLNLSRAVQLSVDIGAHMVADLNVRPPDTMGQIFDLLGAAGIISPELAARLKKAVGFRNVAIHRYEAIDWGIVHEIARNHIDDFTSFARAVTERMDSWKD